MITNTLTPKQLIEKAHIALMRDPNWIWLAPVCMVGNVEITDDDAMPTASTDGKNCAYNIKFLRKLTSQKMINAIVVHENEHKAYMHLVIHEKLVAFYVPKFGLAQARMLVNMAQDYVINRDIIKYINATKTAGKDPILEMPDGIVDYCYDPKYDDEMVWDTVKIADDLQQKADSGGGSGKGQLSDSMDVHDWESVKKINEAEQKGLQKQIEQALRQGKELSRRMAGNVPRSVGKLLEPAVDWRQALRDYVLERAKGKDFATYARPNRRYIGYDMYLPSTYSETIESIAFVCDTSGSISEADLRDVLSEVAGCIDIVQPKFVHMLYWDTKVCRYERYADDDVKNIMQSTKPAGGGGTSPSCVVTFCREKNIKPTVAIWLSDGYTGGDWAEELDVPAFWVITHGGQVPAHLPHVMLPKRGL